MRTRCIPTVEDDVADGPRELCTARCGADAPEVDGLSHRLESLSHLYAMLAAAGTAILRATTREEVYDALCRVVTEEGDFQVVWVGVVDDEGRIVPVARAGTPTSLVTRGDSLRRTPPAMAMRALAEGRAVVVDDTQHAPGAEAWARAHDHYQTRSGCAIPLRCGDEVVAVFSTYMAAPAAYDEDRVALLERLAADVSFALQSIADRQAEADAREARSAVEAELAARAQMHSELARIGQRAFSAESLTELFTEITAAACRVLRLDLAVIEERRADGDLVLRATAGAAERWPGARLLPSSSDVFAGRLFRTGGPLVVADLAAVVPATRFQADPRVRAAAGVAIRRRDDLHGALIAAHHQPRLFAADEVDFLQSLANVAAAALDHHDGNLRLLDQALHDPLTGLPNRTLLFERLEHGARTLRPGRAMAVLLVDLDGFKLINDALGHDVGDELLQAVAERLQTSVRDTDLVARLGGDEFAVLCEGISGLGAAVEVAERLADAMTDPFELDLVQTFVTASIGITLHDGTPSSPRALLREADAAMYVAKESGRARYEVYDDTMRRNAVRRLEITNDLRRALDNDEFELVWQPIVPIQPPSVGSSDRLCVEALLRWNHPERGRVLPDAFIGLAEDTGLIVPIGEWVLRAAGEQLSRWREEDPGTAPELISVNLSAHQLARPAVVGTVHRALADAGVEPRSVVLEITETALMRDPERSIARLGELRSRGFVVSIDDFGTGYSSMSYLRDLPASGLKIDRSFVARLGRGGSDHAIVDAIVGLAHAVGLMAVAEGVESPEQLAALRAMGCDRAQGYLWTRPLAADMVPAWVAAHRAAPASDRWRTIGVG